MGGTTAKIRTGDELSVWDMLHGLMLPSGNDAAICLAENFGEYLYEIINSQMKSAQIAEKNEDGVTNEESKKATVPGIPGEER